MRAGALMDLGSVSVAGLNVALVKLQATSLTAGEG